MRSFILLASAAAMVPAALGLTIATPPQIVQCQPVQLTWAEGTGPFYLSVYPGGQISGALLQFQPFTESSYTWTVNITAGTSITLGVLDSTGTNAYSSPLTVQSSSQDSCLNGGGDTGTTSAASGTTTSETAPSTSSSSSTETTSSSSSTEATTSSSSTRAPPSSTSNSGSGSQSTSPSAPAPSESGNDTDAGLRSEPIAMGLAGVLALVGAAML